MATNPAPAAPKMVARDHCISCASPKLKELSGGTFANEPLRSFIANDPWGENPLPHLESETWSFVECRDCQMKFHRYVLSPEWNDVRFSHWMSEEAIRAFETEHGGGSQAIQHVQHVLRLQKRGVRRVMDFGCGFGQFLEMCGLFGLEAVGVDRSNQRRQGAAVEIVPELEDVTGTFDAITMFEVLEHLDDPLEMLKVLSARLNPSGVMIIEVPDTSGVVSIRTRDEYQKIHPLDHINAFTPETLVSMAKRAGLAPVKKQPAFVTSSVQRIAKDVAKAALRQRSTQRYFVKS